VGQQQDLDLGLGERPEWTARKRVAKAFTSTGDVAMMPATLGMKPQAGLPFLQRRPGLRGRRFEGVNRMPSLALYYPSRRRATPRLRALIDFLRDDGAARS
jgi:DNA-binding transcriptional LysR family regulator